MGKKGKWTFAKVIDSDLASKMVMQSVSDLYRASLNSREAKRELFQRALDAALENLVSWEQIARAEGFDVEAVVDPERCSRQVVLDVDGLKIVQAYGVMVRDAKEGCAK